MSQISEMKFKGKVRLEIWVPEPLQIMWYDGKLWLCRSCCVELENAFSEHTVQLQQERINFESDVKPCCVFQDKYNTEKSLCKTAVRSPLFTLSTCLVLRENIGVRAGPDTPGTRRPLLWREVSVACHFLVNMQTSLHHRRASSPASFPGGMLSPFISPQSWERNQGSSLDRSTLFNNESNLHVSLCPPPFLMRLETFQLEVYFCQ